MSILTDVCQLRNRSFIAPIKWGEIGVVPTLHVDIYGQSLSTAKDELGSRGRGKRGDVRTIILIAVLSFTFQSHAQEEVRLPKYLKTWNETITYRQALTPLVQSGTPRLYQWYANHPMINSPHQISVDFLDRDQFFIRSPRRLILYNMSGLKDGVLMISRRPFQINESETFATLEARLDKFTNGKPTKSFFGSSGFRSFLLSLHSLLVTSAEAEPNASLEWAPVVTMLDIFWKSQVPKTLATITPKSHSLPTVPDASVKKQSRGVK